jgi:hypothetical protein
MSKPRFTVLRRDGVGDYTVVVTATGQCIAVGFATIPCARAWAGQQLRRERG